MTRDEFVKKFKVKDVIKASTYGPLQILYIGITGFYGLNFKNQTEYQYFFNDDYTKVETPKLPSEEIKEIYLSYGGEKAFFDEPTGKMFICLFMWLDKNWPNVQMKGEK